MLLTSLAVTDDNCTTLLKTARRKPSRIVWQQRYDGIATIAYQGGKAIAGISGPWSDRYALTWWVHLPSSAQLELFDSVEAAMDAVVQRSQQEDFPNTADSVGQSEWVPTPRPSWLARVWGAMRGRSAEDARPHLRQRYANEETDLSGMHFRATR
jgi:hypothetical protein